jgi:hypothetical protein
MFARLAKHSQTKLVAIQGKTVLVMMIEQGQGSQEFQEYFKALSWHASAYTKEILK